MTPAPALPPPPPVPVTDADLRDLARAAWLATAHIMEDEQ
jgi:hypothetical protein